MAAKTKQGAEQIVAGFQDLRQQQRAFAAKISELEMDMKEHELVIETLKEVEDDRKCFRMVGGVLVERTVKDVLPALVGNREQEAENTGRPMLLWLQCLWARHFTPIALDVMRGASRMMFSEVATTYYNEIPSQNDPSCSQMGKIVETLTEKLETKGTEINKYREQHNLKIKGEESKEPEKQDQEVKSGGVLVAKDS